MKFVKNFSENQHSMKKKNFRKTEKLKKKCCRHLRHHRSEEESGNKEKTLKNHWSEIEQYCNISPSCKRVWTFLVIVEERTARDWVADKSEPTIYAS